MKTNLRQKLISNEKTQGGRKVSLILLGLGIVLILASVYFGFLRSDGYGKTSALILNVEQAEEDAAPKIEKGDFIVTVSYAVDGVSYTGTFSDWENTYQTGKEIRIIYDLSDPSIIRPCSSNIAVYPLAIGVILVFMGAIAFFRQRKAANVPSHIEQADNEEDTGHKNI